MCKRGFMYIVAPNESEHQLKYTESSVLVDFVLTDDIFECPHAILPVLNRNTFKLGVRE